MACCTRSVQSCHLRKWCNNLVRIFFFAQGRAKARYGGVIGVHFCIILYHLTMLCVNINGIFIAFLTYFLGPLFNGEEDPNLGIFEELKGFLGAHNHEAQFWNDPRHIPQLLEALAGYTQRNSLLEK